MGGTHTSQITPRAQAKTAGTLDFQCVTRTLRSKICEALIEFVTNWRHLSSFKLPGNLWTEHPVFRRLTRKLQLWTNHRKIRFGWNFWDFTPIFVALIRKSTYVGLTTKLYPWFLKILTAPFLLISRTLEELVWMWLRYSTFLFWFEMNLVRKSIWLVSLWTPDLVEENFFMKITLRGKQRRHVSRWILKSQKRCTQVQTEATPDVRRFNRIAHNI